MTKKNLAGLLLLAISGLFAQSGRPTPEEIIHKFAEKEAEFREVWERYTYTQTVRFQVVDELYRVREERKILMEVYFTTDGERKHRVLHDQGSLRSVQVSQADLEDALHRRPFVLTSEELPNYKIKYRGKERVDELDTYKFDVKPKKIRKGKRYFKGRIWVDDQDFQIVMTRGKIVPDYADNKFPEFETIREQIDGKYWFPTWTHADDTLRFGSFLTGYHSVHVRELITYQDFKKFEVDTRITYGPAKKQLRRAGSSQSSSHNQMTLNRVVELLFSFLSKKELGNALSLWHKDSPVLAAFENDVLQAYSTIEKIELRNVTVHRSSVEGDNANVLVSVQITHQHTPGNFEQGKVWGHRFFEESAYLLKCVKADAGWKIWTYVPTIEDFLAVLDIVKNQAEREALARVKWEFYSDQLAQELRTRARQFSEQGDHLSALTLVQTAEHVSNKIPALTQLDHQATLSRAEASGNRYEVAVELRRIAGEYRAVRDYRFAREYYLRSLGEFVKLPERKEIAAAFSLVGLVELALKEYEKALRYFQMSLNRFKALQDGAGIGDALYGIGKVYEQQQNYSLALRYYEQSLTQFEVSGAKKEIAATLLGIGQMHDKQGSFDLALEYFRRSLSEFEELNDRQGIAAAMLVIGVFHHLQQDFRLALQYLEKSRSLFEGANDQQGSASATLAIAALHHAQGNYSSGFAFYRKVLDSVYMLDTTAGIPGTLVGMGMCHQLQGNYDLALKSYRESLSTAEALGDKKSIAGALEAIGSLYMLQENYSSALEYYRRSLELKEKLDDTAKLGGLLNTIGVLHQSRQNYDSALDCFQRSLAVFNRTGNKGGIAGAVTNIAQVHHLQGNYSQAIEFAKRGSMLAREIDSVGLLSGNKTIAGEAFKELDDTGRAKQALGEAIAAIEDLRTRVVGGEVEKQGFFVEKISPYQLMVDLLVQENNFSDALIYAERAKGRVLLDVLSNGRVRITKAMTAEEREQERRLRNRLVWFNTRSYGRRHPQTQTQSRLTNLLSRPDAQVEYENYLTSLYALHPELKVQRAEVDELKLDEARSLLANDRSALVEFVVMEEKTYLFVVTAKESHDLEDSSSSDSVILNVYPVHIQSKDLAQRISLFRKRIADRDARFRQSARELHDILLKPARGPIEGKDALVIVPDGVLWELPFQALQSSDGRYLLEDYALSYAPSLSVLREMQGARRNLEGNQGEIGTPHSESSVLAPSSPPTLLAIGNPDFGGESIERVRFALRGEILESLPETESEVKSLQQMYGAHRSRILIGSEATETRVKGELGKYRILHFATHGIFNNASPMYSQIVLSRSTRGDGEDGLLEAWELMNLDLRANLVVLSACETARGQVARGEGLIGLTWALFVAGCPTTVVSQWNVESSPTTELMLGFHRNLQQKFRDPSKISTAEALRLAALKLMRNSSYRHPFYWAGFVLVGDGR